MNKIAVIYKSKYGSTKKYANWIAGKVGGDIFEVSNVKVKKLFSYDTIIFGGGLYASGINGVSTITKNFEKLKDKNLVVFTIGLARTDDKEIFNPIIQKNFTEQMTKKIKFFHFRGGIDYKDLSFMHKTMMAMLKKMVSKKKPEELSEDDKGILETYGKKVDFTDINTIEPLIEYVKNLN
ncbi:flavodoxin domain-containing protein [Maledivibacter halophilus]|uniref:Protoporphyrinogen IX oxidase, menaquinone-dependent (Flavodoxin domain) n=1 Tax=Maledivibacter halophilus TaxID=36842 RepID=A0A1T5MUP3_9FIRM|nr:flavodoxin domain-containing protein [Maledivibacter halophilus]SKC91931.1 Protoporphyrinogen IX oxidase, menaquinone-dependent (flavodoxin domain) [Maledivibacter halophilus]